ncbi:MAG: phosphoserine phosphatase [Candidatus Azotimanducaceae bacterium]
MSELVLITVAGQDRPGVTAAITECLSQYDVDILDIGQAVIHDSLVLGLLVNIPSVATNDTGLDGSQQGSQQYIQNLVLDLGGDLGVDVSFLPVTESSYAQWTTHQGQPRFILTLLARKIKAAHIAKVSRVIADNGMNIDSIVRLSGRVNVDDKGLDEQGVGAKACVEFSLKGGHENSKSLRTELMQVCSDLEIDIAIQEDGIFRRHRRLICFDMDSTLITTEVIDELAELAGVGEKVSAITSRAMAGELDFRQSLHERVALLKGLSEDCLEEVAAALPLSEGVEHLFETLNRLGYKTAILSGGFDFFGKVLQQKLAIDYVYANRLEIEHGLLTGKVIEPIVDAARKASLVRELAEKEGIALEQVIAVGDGANDLQMLAVAGLGIAFHAKPVVRESAEQSISTLGLDSILYLMGIRDREAERV